MSCQSPAKLTKSMKPTKKLKEITGMKIDELFLNSEYFKLESGNFSSRSSCNGGSGENPWTVDSPRDVPFRKSSSRVSFHKSDLFKTSFLVAPDKNREESHWPTEMKNRNFQTLDNVPDEFLDEFYSEKESERDLISLVTEQMFLAEKELEITRKRLIDTISKLNERDLQILQLHEKIKNLEKTSERKLAKTEGGNKEADECLEKTSEDYLRLVKAAEKLKKQVKDMESFLNDYGLVWVGDKEMTSKPDFDKIIKSFQRLNAVASQPKIIQTTLGAKFELPRELSITLYSNGFLLKGNDFREYGKMTSHFFLQDVEDGYFPSELQNEFPEGVPFEVLDKRNEVYNETSKIKAFQGQGNRLGSALDNKTLQMSLHSLHQKKQNSDHECLEKATLNRSQSKRTKNIGHEVHSKVKSEKRDHGNETSARYWEDKTLRVKIRFGKEKSESFVLDVPENRKMCYFNKQLQRILSEKYCGNHDPETNPPDFEVHVYGANPFRLSDRLNHYPKECGIIDHCVINLAEI